MIPTGTCGLTDAQMRRDIVPVSLGGKVEGDLWTGAPGAQKRAQAKSFRGAVR